LNFEGIDKKSKSRENEIDLTTSFPRIARFMRRATPREKNKKPFINFLGFETKQAQAFLTLGSIPPLNFVLAKERNIRNKESREVERNRREASNELLIEVRSK